MRYSKADFLQAENNTIALDEDISFEPEAFARMHHIRSVPRVHVSGEIHYDVVSERVYADLSVTGVMIVPCSITLEDVEVEFHSESSEQFSFVKSEDADVHETKGDVVELLPVIFQLILMEVPLKVVKPGIGEYPQGRLESNQGRRSQKRKRTGDRSPFSKVARIQSGRLSRRCEHGCTAET